MLYLIQHLFGWLLLVAVAAAFAGWAFRRMRTAADDARLEEEQEHQRRNLINLVEGRAETSIVEHERETDMLRSLSGLRDGQIADLQRQLEEARRARDEGAARIAELERAAHIHWDDAEELQRLRANSAEVDRQRMNLVDADATEVVDHDANAARWNIRYLQQRVRHLESQPNLAEQIAALTTERNIAQARVAELEARPLALAAPVGPVSDNERQRLDWRARYAEARVRYLEGQTAPASEPDPEADNRRRWRQLYLEKRLAYLGEAHDAAHARVAELEPNVVDPRDQRRAAWRERYLSQRVAYLESVRATAPAPAPAAALQPLMEEEPAPVRGPLVPPGSEVRPTSFPAARLGAPDDLTLIEGVSPQQENTLHSLGVFHFDQIAAWTPANVAWVDQYLFLKGRILRERWVEQARDLAETPARALADA